MANSAPSLPLPRGTYTEGGPHPSNGGNPYSDDYRQDVITRWLMGLSPDSDKLNALRDVYTYPSLQTCERYIERWWDYDHVQPMRAPCGEGASRATSRSLGSLSVGLPQGDSQPSQSFSFQHGPRSPPILPCPGGKGGTATWLEEESRFNDVRESVLANKSSQKEHVLDA